MNDRAEEVIRKIFAEATADTRAALVATRFRAAHDAGEWNGVRLSTIVREAFEERVREAEEN
jgi:hypothetical protein